MSSDGETSNRLSAALDEIFHGPTETRTEASDDDAEPTEPSDAEPYVLPEIVPATEEARVDPTLPARPAAEPVAREPERPVTAPTTGRPAAPSPSPTPAPPPATSWADHVAPAPATGLRAPGRKPRVRRVTRVLRHIDPWSTFKVALLFSLVTYLVALTSGVLLWRVADSTGTLDNVERWFTQFGWETFELQGGEVFHNAWIIGLFGVVGLTGALVLLATVFNLVSDIIGGIRMTVLEEEVVERTITSTRRYVVRQGPAAAGTTATPTQDWDVDGGDDPAVATTPAPGASPAAADAVPDTVSDPVPDQDWSVDDD